MGFTSYTPVPFISSPPYLLSTLPTSPQKPFPLPHKINKKHRKHPVVKALVCHSVSHNIPLCPHIFTWRMFILVLSSEITVRLRLPLSFQWFSSLGFLSVGFTVVSHHNQLILAVNQTLNGCFSDSNSCFPGFMGSSDCGQEVKQAVMKVRF